MRCAPRRQRIPGAQRLHSYAAFPDEPVFRVSVVTSLFPTLAPGQGSFRVGLPSSWCSIDLCPGRHNCPLIAVSALSVPSSSSSTSGSRSLRGSFLPPTFVCLLLVPDSSRLGDHRRQLCGQGSPTLVHLQPHQRFVDRGRDRVPAIGQLLMCVPMMIARRMQRGRSSLLTALSPERPVRSASPCRHDRLDGPWLSNGQLTHEAFSPT